MVLDFEKNENGLIPAIIQDSKTKNVLMLGYMNKEAYERTLQTQQVTFFSRTKQRLWTKGEESGNFLNLVDIKLDCDRDTLLVVANPMGPTCHQGTDTCWGDDNLPNYDFLTSLEAIIENRKENKSDSKSYIASLFRQGINKIAQKVGEEAVELVIESKDNDKDLFLNEAADLMYHTIVLLTAKGYRIEDVINILSERHK